MTGNLFFSGGTRYTGTSSNNNFVIRTNNADRLTITAAGAATFSGNLTVGGTLSMGGSKVANVAAPTAAQDAATKAYVDANTGGIPTGAIMAFDLASCPTGWSEYTAARGRFLRGIDSTGAADPDGVRTAGSTQNDALKSHKHATVVEKDTGLFVGFGAGGGGTGAPSSPRYMSAGNATLGSAETSEVGADETRPKNVAVLFCRKN